MENNYSVYVHYFPNGKTYVGLTKQKCESRWGYNGCGYKHQLVYDAICEYGWNNIEHIIVEEGISDKEAQKLERELIEKYDSINNGYNISVGGGLGGSAIQWFEYNGIYYSSDELAEMSPYDLTGHDITNRLNEHGWSLEKTLNTPKGRRGVKFEYNGNYYSLKELYKIRINRDLTFGQIRCRLFHHNWDVERAITQPNNVKLQPSGVGERVYEYKGKMYNSYELSQMSTVAGITPFDITDRINHHGWSVEKALTQPKKDYSKKYLYEGKYYSSKELLQFSQVEGLTVQNIRERIQAGYTVEAALTTPKQIHKK